MKRITLSFVAGIVGTLGYLVHLGPEFLIQTGLRLEAAQTHYIFHAEPERVMDETMVAQFIEPPVTKKGAKKR